MTGTDLIGLFLFAGISLLTAALAVMVTGRFLPLIQPLARKRVPPILSDITRRYEFRDGYLLSEIDPNDAFLDAEIDRSRAFEALRHTLSGLHPEIPARIDALIARGEAYLLTCRFGTDVLTLSGRKQDEDVILTVAPAETVPGREAVDSAVLSALKAETDELRNTLDRSPMLVWKRGADGAIQWANAGYFALIDRLNVAGEIASWPIPDLFEVDTDAMEEPGTHLRHVIDVPDGEAALNFDVSAHRQRDGSRLFMAIPVDRLVAAEVALRSFVQTLSQTFAHLPIGLAVFDKSRELVLFNPALITLSSLEARFLSNRPALVDFLDALRDKQRMPEPKNYRSWRDEIARLEQGAEDGSYQELWTLPTGQTYRVIGRPHPDGAVAFMFEDITSEVSLTREFRAELELHQSLLNHLPGALAVFSSDGKLVFSNAGHSEIWGAALAEASSLSEGLQFWQSHAEASPVWADIRQFADRQTDRASWDKEVYLRNGLGLTCRVAPLAGGAMLVWFDRMLAPQDDVDLPFLGAIAADPATYHDVKEGPSAGPGVVAFEVAEAPAEFVPQRKASPTTTG